MKRTTCAETHSHPSLSHLWIIDKVIGTFHLDAPSLKKQSLFTCDGVKFEGTQLDATEALDTSRH
jgi:hypothetical protein